MRIIFSLRRYFYGTFLTAEYATEENVFFRESLTNFVKHRWELIRGCLHY